MFFIMDVTMNTSSAKLSSIDAYIKSFPKDIQNRMNMMCKAIKGCAPSATEAIAWGMPTFKFNGNLVHFAAFKNHIGFYPAPSGITNFEKELLPYVHAKGSIQFPHDKPIPIGLVKKIVKFRVKENQIKK